MSQLLDRFASKQIMSQLQNSPRSTAQWPHCPSSRHLPSQALICLMLSLRALSHLDKRNTYSVKPRWLMDPAPMSMAGLSEARPPCVLQSFVNHGAVLHKVFVLGEDHFTVERLSLNNFSPGPRGQCGHTLTSSSPSCTFSSFLSLYLSFSFSCLYCAFNNLFQ
ncbi:inositol-tetrakisphosphate 1-kinase 2-like [Oncorhynchus mykiss]|uniref:inositol-tetrakisphosphate 1-kinase 2-like n=1 Tax=Oncorhynchus mykiss TaxID=8022 RepID=UPI0018781D65|nr:inositol-tetrakisphosphate 1-kinase 2-like [Oncorhynchus mykiss]